MFNQNVTTLIFKVIDAYPPPPLPLTKNQEAMTVRVAVGVALDKSKPLYNKRTLSIEYCFLL